MNVHWFLCPFNFLNRIEECNENRAVSSIQEANLLSWLVNEQGGLCQLEPK